MPRPIALRLLELENRGWRCSPGWLGRGLELHHESGCWAEGTNISQAVRAAERCEQFIRRRFDDQLFDAGAGI